MKQNKSVQIIFFSLILSCFFLSGDVFAYKQSDLNKFENTRIWGFYLEILGRRVKIFWVKNLLTLSTLR